VDEYGAIGVDRILSFRKVAMPHRHYKEISLSIKARDTRTDDHIT
jgi:hypothetical protein